MAGASHFLTLYSHFNELLLYLLVPWTAVNLVDYYLIRFGRTMYRPSSRGDGGIYGTTTSRLSCATRGYRVQIPFVATTSTPVLSRGRSAGIDLSWMVGIAVVSPFIISPCAFFSGRCRRRRWRAFQAFASASIRSVLLRSPGLPRRIT